MGMGLEGDEYGEQTMGKGMDGKALFRPRTGAIASRLV